MSVREICEQKNPRLCNNLAKWLTHKIRKESAAITFSTNCDLAIVCLGVRATESLHVRVATSVLRIMKKKVATNGISNLGSATLVLLAMLHCEWSLARTLVHRDVGVSSSLFSLKNCEIVRGGPEIVSRSHRSSLLIIIGYQEDGVFVPVPLVPGYAMGDVDRREVLQVLTIIFCPSTLDTFHHSVIRARWNHGCSFLLLCGRLLLCSGLFAIELRRVVYLLSNSLVQGNKELS